LKLRECVFQDRVFGNQDVQPSRQYGCHGSVTMRTRQPR
jgi:hypothetical protein